MAYYTREIIIPGYGWKIHFFEPSIQELTELQKSYNALDWGEVSRIWANLISSWDCTNRYEQPLPITSEGITQLPHTVLKELTMGFFNALNQDPSDPQAASALSPTSAPEVAESK